MGASGDPRSELAEKLASYRRNPLGFVGFVYPWGQGELAEAKGPWACQARILQAIGAHLANPQTRFQPCRIAMSSGHGVGKTALTSWIIDWGLTTCIDAKAVVTATTEPQLRTKTWPEVRKWFRLSLHGADWWDVGETSIQSKAKRHAGTWRADRLTWSEHNTEAFSGLHNQGKRIILIFDEASGIADAVWEVAEGALTDERTEIIWLAFGNPTQNTGRFRECFGREKHRWQTFQVDSRQVEGTNKEQLERWIADYGEDSDFVRVRVRGEFPRAGSNQFIDADTVAACRKYKAEGYEALPKILGVDVARFGDDQTVLFLRQGRKAQCVGKYRGLDTMQVAARVIAAIEEHQPDAVVVDSDGLGAGVFDQLKHQGYGRKLYEFHGGKPANNPTAYYNRRAEAWGLMRDALKAGMEIPDDAELATDLTGPEYGFSAQQQIQLEKKEDMKKRGLASPDCGDALAMTFAVRLAETRKPKPKPEAEYFESLDWMR